MVNLKWLGCFILSRLLMCRGWSPCPVSMSQNGRMNDLGLLSEVVSWDGGYEWVHGVCGEYHLLTQTEGIYDTKMRVYGSSNTEEVVVVFRPTQQTSQGGDIHVNRRLVNCILFPGCEGLVNDRFQEAFLDLISKLPSSFVENELRGKKVYVTGHSLGGSLQLLMGIHIWKKWDTLPILSLGLAGPFVGDAEFTRKYQDEFKTLLGDGWWQVEAVNRYNQWEVDTTVEGYQVNSWSKLDIHQDAICRLQVDHLPDSYGMHDLRNYRTGLRGVSC